MENKKVINCQAKQERATAAGCGDVTSATFPQKPLLASTKNQANQRRRLSHAVAHPAKRRMLTAITAGLKPRRLGRASLR